MFRDIMILVLDAVLAASFLGILVLGILVLGFALGGLNPRRIAKTITAAVDKIRGCCTWHPLFAFLALGVFIAWAAVDSTPKISRLHANLTGQCGNLSGKCWANDPKNDAGGYNPGPAFPNGFAPAGLKGYDYADPHAFYGEHPR